MSVERTCSNKDSINELSPYLDDLAKISQKNRKGYFFVADQLYQYNLENKSKLKTILDLFLLYYVDYIKAFLHSKSNILLALGFYSFILNYRLASDGERDSCPPLPFKNRIGSDSNLTDDFHIAKYQLDHILNSLPISDIYLLNYELLHHFISAFISEKESLNNYLNYAENLHSSLKKREEKWQLSSFSGRFSNIEKDENRAKRLWLYAAFIFGIGGVFILCYNIYSIIIGEFNITISECIMRLSSTFLLFIIAFWCSKLYSVARNQEIIYRHIAAVLNVYDMFKDSASDTTEKNIIMTEMAHTIFSTPKLPNVKTIGKDDMPQIIELIKLCTDQKNN